MLPVLPKPHKPKKRVYNEKQSKQHAVCMIYLQREVLPKHNRKPQCKIKAKHKESQNRQKPLGGRFLSFILRTIVMVIPCQYTYC